jgi:hypothetical protein
MADGHTGGMIALVPADPTPLVVAGGEAADDMHLTLAYLGDDVTDLDDAARAGLVDAVTEVAAVAPGPVEAEVMGHAAFNPTGAHDRDPCAVYLVSGRGLPELKAAFAGIDTSEHPVFLPHVTAGYGLTPADLSFVGPVRFDRLRVALADQVTDIPLPAAAPISEEPAMPNTLATGRTSTRARPQPAAGGEAVIEQAGPVNAAGEFPIRLPVVAIEGMDTSDGRYLAPGSLSVRGLPLSLLAQPESMHGGTDAGPAGVVGRIDTLQRLPGPEVVSRRTGRPFPAGTFVWVGTGHMNADARVAEYDVADLFRKGYLRGISVDLAGMDYEILGEGDAPPDPDHPRRQLVTHAAEIAAGTLVPIPAFGDAYAELDDDDAVLVPPAPEDLPAGLAASAAPAWRSPEVGDRVPAAVVAAAADGMPVRIPPDSVEQLTTVLETAGVNDPTATAEAVVEHIASNWALDEPVDEAELADPDTSQEEADTGMAARRAARLAADDGGGAPAAADMPADGTALPDDEGDPAAPQECAYGPEPAVRSLMYRDGDAYAPVCDAHEQEARDEITELGETVSDVVDIEPDAGAADGAAGEGAPDGVGDEIAASVGGARPLGASRPAAASGPASGARHATAVRRPAWWFTDPGLDGPTALHVGTDGRIFGHLAAWDVPHIGMPGQRITAPRSPSGYAYFRTGAVLCADGSEVPVGHITLDTGHAATALDHGAAAAHYDSTGTVVADVAAGEDAYGIWVAGALRPHVTDDVAAVLRAAALSGDWRRVGGHLELVAALAVNVPGFPVPRARARVASGQPLALVAAGAIAPDPPDGLNLAALADLIAERLDARRVEGELASQHAALFADLDTAPADAAALLAELDTAPAEVAALFAELADDGDPTAGLDLTDEDVDDADFANWVTKAGGLPPYIKRIQKHLERKGMTESRAIATAVNVVKKMCATGDTNFPGKQEVNAGSRAQACAAVARWEAMKKQAKAS